MMTISPIQPNCAVNESMWAGLGDVISQSRRLSGFDFSVNSGLDLDVAAGVAIVAGQRVELTATETVTLTDSATNFVWLQVDGTVYDNTSSTPSALSDLFLGHVTTSGGAITAIYCWRDLASNIGPALDLRRRNAVTLAAISAGQPLTTVGTINLEAGLYLITGFVHMQGVLSASQGFGIQLDITTAAEYELECAVLAHFDGGSSDESQWTNGGSTITIITTSNSMTCPLQVTGILSLADAGELLIKLTTSSHHNSQRSTFFAKKIA